jgi:hypothetical protein
MITAPCTLPSILLQQVCTKETPFLAFLNGTERLWPEKEILDVPLPSWPRTTVVLPVPPWLRSASSWLRSSYVGQAELSQTVTCHLERSNQRR